MAMVVVAYDISNDRRRVRMHSLLSGFGIPVQESLFECELDDATLKKLRHRIARVARPSDRIRLYVLCNTCATRIDDGRGNSPPHQPDIYIV